MNDQTKPTDDPTLTALRERAKDIQAQIDSADLNRHVLVARQVEINATIEIVQRNGRKKPGPRPGAARAAEVGGTPAAEQESLV